MKIDLYSYDFNITVIIRKNLRSSQYVQDKKALFIATIVKLNEIRRYKIEKLYLQLIFSKYNFLE